MAVPPPLPVTAEQVALLVHDLRNPLAGVTAALQLLGMGLAPSEQEEIRAEATWAVNRLGRMITDLLLLHAGTRGGPSAAGGTMALAPALDDAVRQAALCARLEGVRLEVRCAEGAETAHVAGDPALLQPLLDHLLVAVVPGRRGAGTPHAGRRGALGGGDGAPGRGGRGVAGRAGGGPSRRRGGGVRRPGLG
jgi:hypothetical protein